jgi:2-hydroxychromene-2-carboxylate isomerase
MSDTPARSSAPGRSDAPAPLRFCFDLLSHNAYLAWTQIHALAARHGRSVVPVPVVFGILLKHHGQLGPAEVFPKARWMIKDVLRKAARLGVTLLPPVAHPFNPLLALRVASLPMDEPTRNRVVDGLFRAVWVETRDVMDPAVVADVASAAGLDGEAAVRDAQTQEGKDRLRTVTDNAIAEGVFGVPTVLVDGELFFGFDDFGHLDLFLGGRDPLDRDLLARFMQPRPAFRRKEDPRRVS